MIKSLNEVKGARRLVKGKRHICESLRLGEDERASYRGTANPRQREAWQRKLLEQVC